MADPNPNLPMSSAIFSNLFWRGVAYGSYCSSNNRILPIQDESPTTITAIKPSPVRILVPDKRTGEGTS